MNNETSLSVNSLSVGDNFTLANGIRVIVVRIIGFSWDDKLLARTAITYKTSGGDVGVVKIPEDTSSDDAETVRAYFSGDRILR